MVPNKMMQDFEQRVVHVEVETRKAATDRWNIQEHTCLVVDMLGEEKVPQRLP